MLTCSGTSVSVRQSYVAPHTSCSVITDLHRPGAGYCPQSRQGPVSRVSTLGYFENPFLITFTTLLCHLVDRSIAREVLWY